MDGFRSFRRPFFSVGFPCIFIDKASLIRYFPFQFLQERITDGQDGQKTVDSIHAGARATRSGSLSFHVHAARGGEVEGVLRNGGRGSCFGLPHLFERMQGQAATRESGTKEQRHKGNRSEFYKGGKVG